ncbi:MAG: hypothetical protein PVH88_22720 [Ignavibacteria bacterium]|jgi:hypothetical protein
MRCKKHFWRTTQQQEIDYLEEFENKIEAYEFKWNPNAKRRIPKTFIDAYPSVSNSIIDRGNYDSFLGID